MEPRGTVAVSEDLDPVADLLARRGYRVVRLQEVDWRREGDGLVAVVVSGLGDNLLHVQDPETPAPVINAAGRTAEEVAAEVERRGLRPER